MRLLEIPQTYSAEDIYSDKPSVNKPEAQACRDLVDVFDFFTNVYDDIGLKVREAIWREVWSVYAVVDDSIAWGDLAL